MANSKLKVATIPPAQMGFVEHCCRAGWETSCASAVQPDSYPIRFPRTLDLLLSLDIGFVVDIPLRYFIFMFLNLSIGPHFMGPFGSVRLYCNPVEDHA